MVEYYTAATIILLVLMLAMSIHVLSYSGFNKEQKGWFVATFGAIAFCALAEYALHCGYYDPDFVLPLTILTILQFSVAPCFAMLFAGALGIKHQFKIALIFFASCLIIGICCAPFGAVFTFDDAGRYQRGPYFLIYEITYFISLAYIIVTLVLVGKKFRHRDLGTIIMVLVVLAAGIIPMTIYQLHIAYVTVGIAACLCYVFYNDLVQQDTYSDFLENQHKVTQLQSQISSRLANLIESRDTETGGHVARTSAYCKKLAEDCFKEGMFIKQINRDYIQRLYTLAPLHDVGKILISDTILRKPGKLTPEEFEEIKKHAELGGKVVKEILSGIADEEQIKFASDIATYHHERWDGTGYPKGLFGENIPLSARIMAIADVFDALVSERCYKNPIPVDDAFEIMEKESGSHFDPLLIDIFLRNKEDFKTIFLNTKDK